MPSGVFPDIHHRQAEPEGLHIAGEPPQCPLGDQLAGVFSQRAFHETQFLKEFPGMGVVHARQVTRPVFQTFQGVAESLVDKGQLQSIGLGGVEPAKPFPHLRQEMFVLLQFGQQIVGDPLDKTGDGEFGGQFLDGGHQIAQTLAVLPLQHVHSDLRGDVGIPVTVPAHPGAEADRGAVPVGDAQPGEVMMDPLTQIGKDLPKEVVEIIEHRARLIPG